MLINLLAFFDGEGDSAGQNGSGWWMWVILGVIVVAMVLMMIIPQRKQKKRQEEMMAKLGIGSIVTTKKCTIQFVRQAIHSISPAPGSPEAIAEQKAQKDQADEIDEIK